MRPLADVLLIAGMLVALTGCSPAPMPPPSNSADASAPAPGNVPASAPVNGAAPTIAPASPIVVAAPALALAVDGEGLRLFNPINGAARPLPFGTARDAVLTALAGRGAADSGTQSECGAGPLDYAVWSDGLKLYFQRGKFTGWALDGRATGKVTTAAGVSPGSSRAELQSAYSAKIVQSTLGTEFTAGDLSGLLDGPGPSASIDAMWAGTSCNFR